MDMPIFKDFPEAGCFANIFVSELSDDLEGYPEMDEQTTQLALLIPEFIGYESVRNGKQGIFISYWETAESIEEWRKNPIHQKAKMAGREKWYASYTSQLCFVKSTHRHRL